MKVTAPALQTIPAQSYPGIINSLVEINSVLFISSAGKKIGGTPAAGS